MYEIRNGKTRLSAENVEQLVIRLSEMSGPVSVIVKKQNGLLAVGYVDVEQGMFRGSYGERRPLKATDFLEDGLAFS